MNQEQLVNLLKRYKFSKKVLYVFGKVQRENFVPKNLKRYAYENTTLPIGYGQTISQPQVIALMLSLLRLRKNQKVLEVGSGSGYVLALLSETVGKKGKVFGIERIKQLAEKSKENLVDYRNIRVYNRNGSRGLEEKAPFDKILISAAVREIPQKLLNQLKNRGILVAPKGPTFEQSLVVIQRQKNEFITKNTVPGFIFVPFVEEN